MARSADSGPGAAPPPAGDRRAPAAQRWWPAAVAFAAGLLAYASTLGHDFVWDDTIWLDQKIRFYARPLDVVFEPPDLPTFRVYRPLGQATYWLDLLVWGRAGAGGFHLTSILLHAAAATLVVQTAGALGLGPWPALAAGLLFALHPAHVSAVAWITNRVDVLAGVCALLATLAFLRYRRAPAPLVLVGIAVASFLAAASKETGCVTPALLLAAAVALPAVPGASDGRARWRRPDPYAWRGLGASVAGVVLYFALRPAGRTAGLEPGDFGPTGVALLVQSFGFHLGRALAPVRSALFVPEPPTGIAEWLLGVGGLIAAGWLLWSRPADGGRRRFATLWFLTAVAPAVLVVRTDFSALAAAEHRMYLALIGLALLAGSEAARLAVVLPARAVAAAVAVVLVLCALVTATRTPVWRDDLTLWSAVVAEEPAASLPHQNLGLALSDAERWAEAEAAYAAALARSKDDVARRNVLVNLGHLFLRQKRAEEAIPVFEQASALGAHASGLYGLGAALRLRARGRLDAGDEAGAIDALVAARAALGRALVINPRHHQSHYVLAGVLNQLGDLAGAARHYREVVALAGETAEGRLAADAAAELEAWLADPRRQAPDGS